MKKTIIIILAVVVFALIAVVAFISFDKGGGEINFKATITKVEDGMAYASVTEEYGYLGINKLPENIIFSIAYLDEKLETGNKITGSYIRGTIDGQTVRVVSITVITD